MSTRRQPLERWALGGIAVGAGLVATRLVGNSGATTTLLWLLFVLAVISGIAKTGTG